MPMWMRAAASSRPGDGEVASARGARTDEDRVPRFGEEGAHRLDALAALELDAEAEHIARFLVDHFLGQPEARDLRADHAASLFVTVVDDDVVAQGREIAGHRERRRPGTDTDDALAGALRRGARQACRDVVP